MKKDKISVTKTWKQYNQIKDYLQSINYYTELETNYDFYMGRQWKKLGKKKTDILPINNIITPICNYKIGMVSQNNMTIIYSSENFSEEDLATTEVDGKTISKRMVFDKSTELLTKNAKKFIETNNLESQMWDYIEENCISGTVCMYIYKDKDDVERAEMVYGNNIFFADENEEDIQKQPFIIITSRKSVKEVKELAKENGCSEDDIIKIVRDNDTEELIGNKDEVENDDGKCLCILKLYKKEIRTPIYQTVTRPIFEEQASVNEFGEEVLNSIQVGEEEYQEEIGFEKEYKVHMTHSTKTVEFIKDVNLDLTLYPVAKTIWKREKNNARGVGEPSDKIANQITVNNTEVRRDVAIRMGAYPKLAYLKGVITNPQNLGDVGAMIGVEGKSVQDIRNAIDYLRPAQISPDASAFSNELAEKTRDNASASDAALGTINPEKASGRSIIAVRDASAIPLSTHVSRHKQFYEDIARILFDFWQNTEGDEDKTIPVEDIDENGNKVYRLEIISREIMRQLKIGVTVNVSQIDPYSIYAMEQMWDNLFLQGAINFDEWVSGLSEHSKYNKQKLEEVVKKRKEKEQELLELEQIIKAQQMEAKNIIEGQTQEIDNIANDVEIQQGEVSQMLGGAENAMQPMQNG